jgi:GNAT superfamily N-acetyltransferase
MGSSDNEPRLNPETESSQMKVAFSSDEGPLFFDWQQGLSKDEANGVLINISDGHVGIGYLEASIERGTEGPKFVIEAIAVEDKVMLRKGYGTAMLRKVEQIAHEFEAVSIEASIGRKNLSSVSFFANNGYTLEEVNEPDQTRYRAVKPLIR